MIFKNAQETPAVALTNQSSTGQNTVEALGDDEQPILNDRPK